jgi:hypothetical protein
MLMSVQFGEHSGRGEQIGVRIALPILTQSFVRKA